MTTAQKNAYRDPRWQRKADSIRIRDDYECQGCLTRSELMQVHHIVYIEGRKPWDYADSLLVTLCLPCHEVRHEILKKAYDALKIATARVSTKRLEVICQSIIAQAVKEIEP